MVASLVAQLAKNSPEKETHVRSWGREDPLEKEIATHTSILAWEIPWTEEPGGLLSMWEWEEEGCIRSTGLTETNCYT